VVHHEIAQPSGQHSQHGQVTAAFKHSRPALILEALLGVERLAADARAVQVQATATATATTASVSASDDVFPAEGLTKAAGGAVAAAWAAVHALTLVPLPPPGAAQAAGTVQSLNSLTPFFARLES
jgi:hypothetical protein